jgi:hypothetical protein
LALSVRCQEQHLGGESRSSETLPGARIRDVLRTAA